MTPILYFVFPLVFVLYVLILSMTHGKHFAPQAYYRKKRRGANVLLGLMSNVPRARRELTEREPRR
ncbi:MAG TPA: hypothetical protein VN672_07400 [Solirubrobacteraceae bacterium]|nr:hypothetical protein [Solirubrobacteraceae bacterium]